MMRFGSDSARSKQSATHEEEPQASSDTNAGYPSAVEVSHNVWEHESLLQAVADRLEARLTAGQIDAIIQVAKAALGSADIQSHPEQHLESAAYLVVLDCVLSGCRAENTISKLSMTARELYSTLLDLVTAERMPQDLTWRVWRSMATIKDRWKAELSYEADVQNLEDEVTKYALKLHSEAEDYYSVNELLHSFNYTLSVRVSGKLPMQNEYGRFIVQTVTRAKQYYHQLVRDNAVMDSRSSLGKLQYSKDAQTLHEYLPLCSSLLYSRPVLLM